MKSGARSIPVVLGLVILVITPTLQTQDRSFRQDGNLVVTNQGTENGSLKFIVNDGFLAEPNQSMIFCSGLAKALDIPTCLWNNKSREKLYSEVIWTLAVQPAVESVSQTDSMMLAAWFSGKYKDILDAMDAFKMNSWNTGASGAALHNTIAKTLRTINPRSWNGQPLKLTNLKAAGRVLEGLDVGMKISAAAIGALIQSAFYSDFALERLAILEDAISSYSDPAIHPALSRIRAGLTWGDTDWKAFLVEFEKQKDIFIKMGLDIGLKAVFKALGVKGSFGVLLVFETILSDWQQHAEAQWAVLAATIEETLAAAASKEAGTARGCELERMAATARFLYFDRMVQVTSVWQGRLVDLLSKGAPYADAKQYYSSQRAARLRLMETARRKTCWIPTELSPIASATGGEAVLVIDSSGSMADNDPRRLRIQAAQMLAGRLISDRPISVVNFDEQARLLIAHETRQDPVNAAISGIGSNGRTCIPRGLEAAARALKDAGGAGMAILFTDGHNTACQGDAPAWFSDSRIPIYVIGFSDAVNETYLQRMAFSTGGEYMKARTASDLPGIFDWIGTMAGMEDLVDEVSGKISQGETNEFPFPVDSLAERLTCRNWYPGSRIVLDLVAPDGNVIDKNAQGVKHLVGATYELIEVENPRTGTWKARLTAVETEPQGEAFNIRVGMKSTSPISVEMSIPAAPEEDYSFDLRYDAGAISAKSFEGKVIYPNGTSAPLPPASPGHWEVPKPTFGGIHQFLFYIEGTDAKGLSLKRIAQKSLFIDGPQMPHNPVIIRIAGAFGTINMGQNIGLRPGMRIEIRSGNNLVGYGYISSVFYDFAQVEFTEPRGRTWRIGDEAVPIRAPER